MKILDKIGLIIFSDLMLVISVIICLLIFGWLSPQTMYDFTVAALNDPIATNTVLVISII